MTEEPKKLHPAAFRELKPGETYVPVVPATESPFEVTIRSVGIGAIMGVIFSLASAYLALKAGQGMEPAIPIAILAVGMSGIFARRKKRRSTILENVIIQSVGAASGAVVAGAVFTIPALYMLNVHVSFWHIFFTAFFGGCLGVFFLIPLRQYLMVKEHGKLPFPEAMATTEILVAGESAGQQAKTLVWSAAIAFAYDLCVLTFSLWREIITFNAVKIGQWLDRRAMAVRVDGLAAIVGLGYIVGLKYASIIAAGSFLSYLVFIPFVKFVGGHLSGIIPPGTVPIADMGVDDIFSNYVRLIGIGGIAGAGIMGIIRSLPSIVQSFSLGIKGIAAARTGEGDVPRTDRNLGMRDVLLGIIAIAVCLWIFFKTGPTTSAVGLAGVGIALVISFLFTLVAARAIGLIGTNPVSGMTLVTLIITSVVLARFGLSGEKGMFVALIIGGVVCTALAVAGAFATDLKIGYWIGSTPRNQQRFKFIGILVAAASCALAMMLLGSTYQFGSQQMPAPQASAMREIIVGLMGGGAGVQWILFAFGVIVSVILALVSVPALAFALGMYLPIQLNTAVLLGGFLSYLVAKSTKDEKVLKERNERGILVASGYIAGGSIAGVVAAVFAATGLQARLTVPWPGTSFDSWGELLAIVMLVLLSVFMYRYSTKASHR